MDLTMADRHSRSRSRSRTTRSTVPGAQRVQTRIVIARGTEIAVPIDILQKIPYSEKRSRSGWLDSEDSKAYVDIHAKHFHVILDIMEYAKQDNTPPEEFIPSTISVAAVLGAASMLGLVDAQPEVEQPGATSSDELLRHAFKMLQENGKLHLSMRRVRDTLECRMCGNPFVPHLNNPAACACHPVACLILETPYLRCTQCGLSGEIGNTWNLRESKYFCYKGPHVPRATEERL